MEDDPTDEPIRGMSFLAAAAWTLVVGLVFGLLVQGTDSLHPGASHDLMSRTLCVLIAYGLVTFGILRVHSPEASIRSVLGLRPHRISISLLAVFVGAGLAAPTDALRHLLSLRAAPEDIDTEFLAQLFDAPTPAKKVLLVVTMVAIVPMCDELFFRGALFSSLKRGRKVETVILATAAYDTLISVSGAWEIPSMLILSFAFAWFRGLSGSVVPAVLARMAYAAATIVPMMFGKELPTNRTFLLGSGAVAAVALALAVLLTRRDQAPDDEERKSEDG